MILEIDLLFNERIHIFRQNVQQSINDIVNTKAREACKYERKRHAPQSIVIMN